MSQKMITPALLERLRSYLQSHPRAELINAYLFFTEKKLKLKPVVFPKEKKIYRDADALVSALEEKGDLWRETEIKINFGQGNVNQDTQKIYICPFTGKVFGDNTHPNPQDAIYNWVSKCPENTERAGGLKVKRFFVSDDPEVIREYASKEKARPAITKVVYSSVINGKLYHSKERIVQDFRKHYIKPISLVEVPGQNKFDLEEDFLGFIQEILQETNIAAFVEELAEHEDFLLHVNRWIGGEEEEEEGDEEE